MEKEKEEAVKKVKPELNQEGANPQLNK